MTIPIRRELRDFNEPVAARLPPRRLLRVGRSRPIARVVICVHGVGRNGRDFDVLGEALAPTHRVLAVDMPGRGESDWLADPNDYVFPTYLTTLTALIARSGAETRRLGRHVDGRPARHGRWRRSRTRRSRGSSSTTSGPPIEPAALERIRGYFGLDPDVRDATPRSTHYIRTVSAPFGPLTDAQWEHLTRTNVRAATPTAAGRLAYDPGHRRAVPQRRAAPPDLWPLWDAIRCPTLVLRGAQSDLLSAATARADGRARAQGRGRRVRRASATRRCCCPPTRSIRSSASCAAERLTGRIAARGRGSCSADARGRRGRKPAPSLTIAVAQPCATMPLALSLPAVDPAAGQSAGNPAGQGRAVARRGADARPGRGGPRHRRRAGGHQPRRDERLASGSSSPRSTGRPPTRCGRCSRSSSRGRRTRCPARRSRRPRPRSTLAQRAFGRLQAPARARGGQAHLARRATGCWSRWSTAACNARRASSSTATCRTRRCRRDLARRAPHLRVRARARPAPARRSRPTSPRPRRSASTSRRCCSRSPIPTASCRASSHTVLRYVQEYCALGEAHRRRAGAPDGEGRGDRSGRPRLPAVLGEQGRLDRRQQALPADLRPRVPDPGAAARARGRRRRSRRASAGSRRRGCSTSRC